MSNDKCDIAHTSMSNWKEYKYYDVGSQKTWLI